MNFLIFLLYYFICTLILFFIFYLIYKFYLKKRCFDFSKLAEKEIDNYFHAYDDDINSLLNDMKKEEGDTDDDSINW